jgi:hypothetical protein
MKQSVRHSGTLGSGAHRSGLGHIHGLPLRADGMGRLAQLLFATRPDLDLCTRPNRLGRNRKADAFRAAGNENSQ